MLPVQLLEWNRTEADYPRESTIAELFAEQAARTPDTVALIAKDRQLSYRELDERANKLARHLQELGVRPDTLVGVAMGRTETLIVAMLAILKAGGAYVPLDPGYPKERLSLVIDQRGDARTDSTGRADRSRRRRCDCCARKSAGRAIRCNQ
jgi:arthrofactin-type cyclic lipopeptide synthetase A